MKTLRHQAVVARASRPCVAIGFVVWRGFETHGRDARATTKILFALALLAAFAPTPAFACAACYGRSDSPLASGMNWGIFTLLGIVVTVLLCVASFFIYIVRRQIAYDKAVEQQQNLSEVKV